MNRQNIRVSIVIVALLFAARPALAGPPLLCHPFDIGTARSLPWDGAQSWFHGRADYDITHLLADTQALLTPATPVIVRMETLRRAAIYASRDPQIASRLLHALSERAEQSERAGKGDPLALLDAAYITEALRQVTYLGEMAEFRTRAAALRDVVGNADGYALVKRSIALSPDEPALQFAAALIAADKNRGAYVQHAQKARKGAAQDSLLARNISHVS